MRMPKKGSQKVIDNQLKWSIPSKLTTNIDSVDPVFLYGTGLLKEERKGRENIKEKIFIDYFFGVRQIRLTSKIQEQ